MVSGDYCFVTVLNVVDFEIGLIKGHNSKVLTVKGRPLDLIYLNNDFTE